MIYRFLHTGTLYGRCKKGGIELSKTSNVLWSEDDMNKALESVKTGGMSINQVRFLETFLKLCPNFVDSSRLHSALCLKKMK